METAIRNQNENFVYDPNISGNDNAFWKEVTGTLSVSGTAPSAVLRWTSAVAASYSFYKFAKATFRMTIPTAPATGDDKSWGFAVPAAGGSLSILFDITDDVFKVLVKNISGTTLTEKTITWNEDWDGAAVNYEIRWFPSGIVFAINGAIIHRYLHDGAANRVTLDFPLPFYISNANADNVDLGALIVSDIQSFT